MATIAVIGGSGLYELEGLTILKSEEVNTPFGKPSAAITIGKLGESTLLFLARHGPGHILLPSEINYRANIFALKMLGAEWCISVSAVGSLQEELPPGAIVIPDQFIDRTRTRADTFFGRGVATHVSMANPVCPVLAQTLYAVASKAKTDQVVKFRGTYLCIEGPTFSTRAESNLYRQWGADIIGMTNIPEAKLAREAELSYATLALVTDYDSWHDGYNAVEVADVLTLLKQMTGFAKEVIRQSVPVLETKTPSELVRTALDKAFIGNPDMIPEKTREILKPIIGRIF